MPELIPIKYKCATCGGVFQTGWSEEEAQAESKKHFGEILEEHQVRVCDDCYQSVMPEENQDRVESYKAEKN